MRASTDERDLSELEFILESIELVQKWTERGKPAIADEITGEAIENRMRKLAQSTQRLSTHLKDGEPEVS